MMALPLGLMAESAITPSGRGGRGYGILRMRHMAILLPGHKPTLTPVWRNQDGIIMAPGFIIGKSQFGPAYVYPLERY